MTRRLGRLATTVEEGWFSEEAVRRVLAIMRRLQKCHHARAVASATMEDPWEPGTFLYERHLPVSPKVASRLNARFVDEVVAEPGLLDDPGFRFVAVFVGLGT